MSFKITPRFWLLVLIYSTLTLYALITLMPFFWMLLTSFKEPADIFKLPPEFVPTKLFSDEPFANYSEVWNKQSFVLLFRNSAFVATMAALGQVFTCSLGGYAFAKLELPGKNILFAVVLATAFIPGEVTIIPEFLIMRSLGWVDTFLPLIVPSFFVGAFGTFMLREFFGGMPKEYGEAAYVDGASQFQIFWKIYLPMATPALVSVFVIAFIHNWDKLLRPIIYLNSPELFTLPLGLMKFVGQYESAWTLLMSGSVISTLPLILLYIFTQRYVLQGFAGGGVKG